jgi:hypothetical protein
MTTEHDPLEEPLRLLRETSLAADFEERLAERLTTAHRQGVAPVFRLPSRKRTWLLIAAIALPAAAAASGYWVERRFATSAPNGNAKQVEAKPLGHLPKAAFTGNVRGATPAVPAIEELRAPRAREASRPHGVAPNTEKPRATRAETAKPTPAPQTNEGPRIEALDPFVSKSAASKPSASLQKSVDVSENLRKATDQGAARTGDARVRDSQRERNANENRGNDAAQQARERVQARERKGQ